MGVAEVLDRVAYAVSPQWGMRRMAYRRAYQQMLAFGESDRSRRSAVKGTAHYVNDELNRHLPNIRRDALKLYEENPYAHGIVESRVSQEIGAGLTYRPTVRKEFGFITESQSKRINDKLRETVDLVSQFGVDRSGVHGFGAFYRLADRTWCNQGEVFVEIGSRPTSQAPIPMTMEIIDAERIETPFGREADPNIFMGIETNRSGEVIAYYVRDSHPQDPKNPKMTWTRVPRYDRRGRPRMLHMFEPMIPGQTRGLPWLVASLTRFQDLADVTEAEVAAMQVQALLHTFIQSDKYTSPMEKAAMNATRQESGADGKAYRVEELYPGMIEYIGAEDKVFFNDPNRPGNNYAPFAEQWMRMLCTACNYPYNAFSKNYTGETFSSGRLAMLDGWTGMMARMNLLSHGLAKPIGRQVVWESVLVGDLADLVDAQKYRLRPHFYERHEWYGNGKTFIDPQAEQKANTEGVNEDQMTLTSVLAERNIDLDEHMETRKREKELLLRQEIELRKLQMELEEQAGVIVAEDPEAQPQPGQPGTPAKKPPSKPQPKKKAPANAN